jgi:catalase
MEFIRDQYRHGKTLLVLGASRALIDKAGLPATLPGGKADPGLLMTKGGDVSGAIEAFIAAVAGPRHAERETDPPLV